MDSGMLVLLLVLGGVLLYLIFSPTSLIGPWLDKYCREEKRRWSKSPDVAETIEPNYQENIPFTPSLEKSFDDPEVPNRLSKKKPKKKRVYKRRKKK